MLHLPSPFRWYERVAKIGASGVDGVLAFPYFKPFYASLSAEIQKFAWLSPARDPGSVVQALAERTAGPIGATKLVSAWNLVAEAIALSPQIPVYFTGPQFLGAAHPLLLNSTSPLPSVFYGRLLYLAEVDESMGLELGTNHIMRSPQVRPITSLSDEGSVISVSPPGNNLDNFARRYRKMAELLGGAVLEVDAAFTLATRDTVVLESEMSMIRWLHHSVRTTANFYDAHRLLNCIENIDRPLVERRACHEQLGSLAGC